MSRIFMTAGTIVLAITVIFATKANKRFVTFASVTKTNNIKEAFYR